MADTPLTTIDTEAEAPALVDESWRVDASGVARMRRGPIDIVLLTLVGALVGIGLVAVYAGSAYQGLGAASMDADLSDFRRQAQGALLGFAAMLVTSRLDYRWYSRNIYLVLIPAYILLALVVATPLGETVKGATRWLAIGPLRLQPAEYAKIAIVLYLAYSIAKKGDGIKKLLDSFVWHTLVVAGMVVLLYPQPDFGSSVVIALMMIAMLFVGGARLSVLIAGGVVAAVLAVWAVLAEAYRMDRIESWLNPWAYADTTGYQLTSSYVALASGGTTGTGVSAGRGWLGYVPELYNDFVAVLIGEAFGLVGMGILLILYVLLFWRGIRIAVRARDELGMLMAFGISTLIALQAAINLAVVTGLFPTKGLTLPFVSYGRSSLVLLLASIGILLNIAQRNPDLVALREEDARRADADESQRKRLRDVDVRRRSRVIDALR